MVHAALKRARTRDSDISTKYNNIVEIDSYYILVCI